MGINSTTIWTLISVAFGAILGGFISYVSAISILKRQEKHKAGAEFIASFIEIQRLLEIMHPNHSSEYKKTPLIC